jgi:hypothetical protein
MSEDRTQIPDRNPIIVPCEACGTEGRIEHFTHYDCNGNECGWSEPCPYCQGTGGEEVEGQLIELEDAEFLAMPAPDAPGSRSCDGTLGVTKEKR